MDDVNDINSAIKMIIQEKEDDKIERKLKRIAGSIFSLVTHSSLARAPKIAADLPPGQAI